MYRLYLLQKIEAGEKDAAEGKTLSHKEAAKQVAEE
jgi:predicted transcriptional regulator